MFLRLIMLFSVLVSTVLYQLFSGVGSEVVVRTYLITFFTFLITTAFIFLYEKARYVSYFVTSQVAYDVLFTTALIFYTGLADSMYTVFYIFNILFAAIIFGRMGAIMAALLSAAMYMIVTAVNAESASDERLFRQVTTVTAFVAIALLAGQLIDELRKSRLQINVLERLSEEIVESLDSGLLGLDANAVVRKVNRTALELLAIPDQSMVLGKPFREIAPGLGEARETGVRELAVRGRMRRILVTRVVLPEAHGLVVLRDLTDVLELEERLRRQERLAGVGRLAAGVAHEIRNPIASISGAAQLLGTSAADGDETKRLSQIIVRESERVDRLVAQLLTFARPAAARREPVELSQIVRECVESLKARPDFSEQEIDIRVSLEGPLLMRGDKDELREVVTNLIVNAMQALGEKNARAPKRLAIEGAKRERFIELVISDNGPGIPREFRERIFDPFFTTKAQGTGLGLARVHKIVREHDGQVDFETEEGKGTSLKVRLPA
jgi:two-component system sensor histidine kinase PilS (NtrC family)